jgi:transposase
LPHSGAPRADASAAILLHTEDAIGDGRGAVWNFYFRPFPDGIRSSQGVKLLKQLLRRLPGILAIVRDGLSSHRSSLVWNFVRPQPELRRLEFLPSDTRKLNPVEYLWGNWKQHELPNFCPDS